MALCFDNYATSPFIVFAYNVSLSMMYQCNFRAVQGLHRSMDNKTYKLSIAIYWISGSPLPKINFTTVACRHTCRVPRAWHPDSVAACISASCPTRRAPREPAQE